MRQLPHASGFTLLADAFMGPDEMVGFYIDLQPRTIFSHFHDFYELAFVTSGRGQHITEQGSEPLRRGNAMFVVPGIGHGFEHSEDLVIYNCLVRAELARFDLSWAPRDQRLRRLFAPGGIQPSRPAVVMLDEGELTACLAHMDAIRHRPSQERSEAFELGHLLLALDVVASHLEDGAGIEPGPTAPVLVSTAVGLIERDLRHHWTLPALAQVLAVDPFHLVRLFKRSTGVPPIAFANRQRARRAASLLALTDDPIAKVGSDVGWPDPSHFSRRFRQEHGVSPRTFRAQQRDLHARGRRDPTEPEASLPPQVAAAG
jgi:AraC family transcriptional regulator, L-rhamnose operon transcriptional activator RhaR